MRDENYASIKFAELDSPPNERTRKEWSGIYRGVRYEISNFAFSSDDRMKRWAHYLIIHIDDQLTAEIAESLWLPPKYMRFSENGKEHCSYREYESRISEIKFHGGCTWYSKETSVDEKARVIKVGCDYQHIWDEGKEYSLNYVFQEVKISIDSFIDAFGPIKIRSSGDGKYRYLEDFEK